MMKGGVNQHWPHLRSDKVIVITGANTGLGLECAIEIAQIRPATIILACRNKQRGTEAVNKIIN
jgi:retinol dehydrogenase-12